MIINPWPKRLYMLDSARGLAALAITLWHWQHFVLLGTIPILVNLDKSEQPLYFLLKPFYEAGTLGVNFFFLLSGFIFFWLYSEKIKEHKINFTIYLWQRFTRLYPLHLLTLFLVIALQLLYMSYYEFGFVYGNFDFYHFFLNLFLMQNWGFEEGFSFNGPSWAVSILLLMYLIFFVLAYFRKIGFWFCLLISLTAAILLIVDSADDYFNRYLLRGLTGFFWGGCIFYITTFLIKQFASSRYLIYPLTILLWLSSLFSIYIQDLTPYIEQFGFLGKVFLEGFPLYILFTLTIISLVFLELTRGPWFPRLAVLGDISYSIFLLHFPLQLIFVLAVTYSGMEITLYDNLIVFIVYFIILFSLSYLSLKKFESPMQDWLRSYLNTSKSNTA